MAESAAKPHRIITPSRKLTVQRQPCWRDAGRLADEILMESVYTRLLYVTTRVQQRILSRCHGCVDSVRCFIESIIIRRHRIAVDPEAHAYMRERLEDWQNKNMKGSWELPTVTSWYYDVRCDAIDRNSSRPWPVANREWILITSGKFFKVRVQIPSQ